MTAVSKPLYWSVGVPFNELFWASSTGALTENAANLLYLQKTVADTASVLETFSGGLLTNSVGALAITSNLEIATSQTSGVLNIGTLATREAAGVINIGASGGLHTIVMDTSSVANTNAAPAISIGTSASAKTIKINNNSNSVHCSSIDLKGASINHIVANSATPITIGDGQTNSAGGLLIGCSAAGNVRTSAPIKIGADTTTTSAITVGASGSSTSLLGTTTVSNLKADALTRATGGLLSIGTTTATSMTLGSASCAVACNGLLTSTAGIKSNSYDINLLSPSELSFGAGVTNDIVRIAENITTGQVLIGNGASCAGACYIMTSGTTARTIGIGSTVATTTINLNGDVTLQKPLTLGTAPTTATQLGGVTAGSFLTPASAFSTTKTVATVTVPAVGLYLCTFSFQVNFTVLPTANYITTGGTSTGFPAAVIGMNIITTGANGGMSGSFFAQITAVGTITLVYNVTGTVNSLSSTLYQINRLA